MAYVTAVHDMYDFGGIISPSRHVTVGQVSEVVGSYLKANPIEWDSPAAILVRDGLVAAFPCRRQILFTFQFFFVTDGMRRVLVIHMRHTQLDTVVLVVSHDPVHGLAQI